MPRTVPQTCLVKILYSSSLGKWSLLPSGPSVWLTVWGMHISSGKPRSCVRASSERANRRQTKSSFSLHICRPVLPHMVGNSSNMRNVQILGGQKKIFFKNSNFFLTSFLTVLTHPSGANTNVAFSKIFLVTQTTLISFLSDLLQ